MNHQISYPDSIKEAIVIAFIQLLKQKNINKITIQEIVKKAGVSRSSFYRHYDSKEDILLDYMNQLFDATQLKINPFSDENIKDYAVSQFCLCKENKDFFIALKQNDLLYLLFQQVNYNVKRNIASFHLYKNPYQAIFFASAAIGVIIQWIENDFQESEEELADMFIYLMDGHHKENN